MDFKQKMQMRLCAGCFFVVIGLALMAWALISQTDNSFVGCLGLGLAVAGAVRVRNYLIITRTEQSLRRQMIAETDERNVSIWSRAKSLTLTIYVLVLAFAAVVLSLMGRQEQVQWIAWLMLLLCVIYMAVYCVLRKRS